MDTQERCFKIGDIEYHLKLIEQPGKTRLRTKESGRLKLSEYERIRMAEGLVECQKVRKGVKLKKRVLGKFTRNEGTTIYGASECELKIFLNRDHRLSKDCFRLKIEVYETCEDAGKSSFERAYERIGFRWRENQNPLEEISCQT